MDAFRTMKTARIILCVTWLGAASAWNARAQLARTSAQGWDGAGTGGWTNAAGTLSNPGGYLNLPMRAQGQPRLASDMAQAPLEAGLLPTNISFRFSARDLAPSAVRLCLHSRRDRATWYVSLPPPERGQSAQWSIGVDAAAGWIRGPGPGGLSFQEAMRSLDWVGVYVRRHGAGVAQAFALDDFVVEGLAFPGDADMDGLPDEWENGHGLNAGDGTDAQADADADGMSNWAEYRAGTDPTNAASVFLVEAGTRGAPGENGVAVWWRSITNRSYAVWRSVDLTASFRLVEAGVPATPPRNTYVDGVATNAGPYFYRIQVEL